MTIEELAETFINGNISSVREALAEMAPMDAATAAVDIYETISAWGYGGAATTFQNYLARWGSGENPINDEFDEDDTEDELDDEDD